MSGGLGEDVVMEVGEEVVGGEGGVVVVVVRVMVVGGEEGGYNLVEEPVMGVKE